MNIEDFKAGKLVQQYDYKSFSPVHVSREWIASDHSLNSLLSLANRKLGELNAFSQLIPDVDFSIMMHMTKKTTKSSRIESMQTSTEEAFIEEENVLPERRDDWKEVQKYITAMNKAIKERNKPHYYDNLTVVCTHNNLTQWIRFFLAGVLETATNSINTFHKIIALKGEIESEELLTLGQKQVRAIQMINELYSRPITTATRIGDVLDVSPATTNRFISDFINLSILKKGTGYKRNRIFIFEEYLNLFN
jgi:Fic family protein